MQWVPSHVDTSHCEDPVAAYAVQWNHAADLHAGLMNQMRPAAFLARHQKVLTHRQRLRRRLSDLVQQYLSVAAATNVARRSLEDEEDMVVAELVQSMAQERDSFADLFPPNWQQFLRGCEGLGAVEAQDILQRVLSGEDEDLPKFKVSWIELVFYVVVVLGCGDRHRNRTLAFWVTSLRRILRPLLIRFGAEGWLVRVSLYGVAFSVEALVMGVSLENFRRAQCLFQEWRGTRAIKKVADLSRPIWPA